METFNINISQECTNVFYTAALLIEAETYEEALKIAKNMSQEEMEEIADWWELDTDGAESVWGTIQIEE